MSRLVLLIALVAALAVASSASSASSARRTLTTAAPVRQLAADGSRVALAVTRRRGDCDHVALWLQATGSVVRLGRQRPCGEEGSTGSGLVGPALAGTRALWITYVGGNIREWTLWTATPPRRTPRQVAFVARDVEADPPFVLGAGDASRAGFLLPYAVDRTVVALGTDGRRRFGWSAPGRVVSLAARAGRLAVGLENGAVHVLDASGREIDRLRETGVPASAVGIARTGIVRQQGSQLVLRTGRDLETVWDLPARARLVDVEGSTALYVARGVVYRLPLAGGSATIVARGTGRVSAALEGRRLTYATGRRVVFRALP